MKTLCIYHKDCTDGAAAAAVVRHKYPDSELIAIDHGEAPPKGLAGKRVYLVDFSFPAKLLVAMKKSVNRSCPGVRRFRLRPPHIRELFASRIPRSLERQLLAFSPERFLPRSHPHRCVVRPATASTEPASFAARIDPVYRPTNWLLPTADCLLIYKVLLGSTWIGQSFGLNGLRGFRPDFNADLIDVRRLTPVILSR
jgi:hypothetical protein